jgi:rRNA-processing protein FCF1
VEAYAEREKKEWFRTAWLASQIVSYIIGKRVEISDLLPEMFPAKVWTKEEVKKELDELKKRLKIE